MKIITAVIFCLVLVTFSSCKRTDHSQAIKELDSLLVALEDAGVRYNTLETSRLGAQVDSVNRHLEYVQKNYVGYQREDMAKVLSDYRRVKKLIPDINKEHQRILTEISTGKTQLTHLKQALAEGSTHDAAGNKITEEYIDKVYAEETKTARDLIAQLGQLFERVPLADSLYQANYSKVRFWVDSIPKVQAPTLAVPK
jgi:hypothetical protein